MEITHAPAPGRSTAQFTLMLGMVPVPIRLFTPTEDTTLVDRKLYREIVDENGEVTYNKVGAPTTDLVTGERIGRDQCKKMVEYGDELIEMSDDEVAAVTAGQAVDKGCVQIETFIPVDALGDRYVSWKWYQARPQEREIPNGKRKKKVPDPVADKAFTLLLEALRAENVAALVRVGLRSNARFGVLTPTGQFHFLHYDEEVREERDFPDVEVSDAELDMARQLLTNIGISTPPLVDEAGAAVQEYLAKKAAGDVEAMEVAAAPVVDNVVDLTSMLAASVQQVTAKAG